MPRTNYVPNWERPIGFAFPYLDRDRHEDKPTVEVDMIRPGMKDALIEAVCMALECWDPVFDHWEEVPPTENPDGSVTLNRQIPHFRGRHAGLVRKFRDDIFGYMARNHESDWQNQTFLKIASKYVYIRPLESGAQQRHTSYTRETVRPLIRRSDPEWDKVMVYATRARIYDLMRAMIRGSENSAPWDRLHLPVFNMVWYYDDNHGTLFRYAYEAEFEELLREHAHLWEHLRLISFYVQGIADTDMDLLAPPNVNRYRAIHVRHNPPKEKARPA